MKAQSFNLSNAVEALNHCQERVEEAERVGSLGTPEVMQMIIQATLIHQFITQQYGPEWFTDDECEDIENFVEYLTEVLVDIESGETYDD